MRDPSTPLVGLLKAFLFLSLLWNYVLLSFSIERMTFRISFNAICKEVKLGLRVRKGGVHVIHLELVIAGWLREGI